MRRTCEPLAAMHQLLQDERPWLGRRQIFHIAGYEPEPLAEHYGRFVRQLEIFKRTWGVEASASAARKQERRLSWSVDTSGPNWQVRTDYEFWGWDDIVREAAAKPSLQRLWDATVAYLDFLFTGTIFRYVKANARYFLFTLVPPLEIVAFAAVAVLGSYYLAQALGLVGAARMAVIVAVGFASFFLLLRWPGRRLRVEQALDDWIFSRAYIRGLSPDVDARMELFAELAGRQRAGTAGRRDCNCRPQPGSDPCHRRRGACLGARSGPRTPRSVGQHPDGRRHHTQMSRCIRPRPASARRSPRSSMSRRSTGRSTTREATRSASTGSIRRRCARLIATASTASP